MSGHTPFAASDATQKNRLGAEAPSPRNTHMLNKPELSDQQGVRDFVTEGTCSLSAIEMNQVLLNCAYEHQRGISERHVAVLADLMNRNRWQPKSQLDFAVLDGRYILVNGYHRAYAQVRSGHKITWSIALHPVKSAGDLRALYYAFDTNIRPRSKLDILKAVEFTEMTGVAPGMAGALYAAVPYLASKFTVTTKDRNFLVERQTDRRLAVAAGYSKAAARLSAAIEGMPGIRRLKFKNGAVVAVAVATFRYQSETAWAFWTGVAQNDGLKRGDPRLALCNDFMTRRAVGSRSIEAFAPSIIAWNAFFNERPLQLIKVLDTFQPIIDGTPFDGKPAKVQ